MAYELRVEAAQRTGDDRVAVSEHEGSVVFVVADGAGGSGSGDVAADALVASIREFRTDADLAQVLSDVDQRIHAAGHGGETTAVVARVVGEEIVGASIGYSGAWLIGDSIIDLTRQQVRKPLLGSGRAQAVPFEAKFNGRLLLASDGLLKYVPRDRITELARLPSLSDAADALVLASRLPSGGLNDDIALIIAG